MLNESEYFNAVLTQSQNSSAKLALIIQEKALNYYEIRSKKILSWLRLSDNFQSSASGFGFYGSNFFFPIVDNAAQQLFEAGVMNNLVMRILRTKFKIEKVKNAKVLLVNDLSFGFVIWLVSCGISIVIFGCEMIQMIKVSKFRTRKYKSKIIGERNYKKIEFAKVHPINDNRY